MDIAFRESRDAKPHRQNFSRASGVARRIGGIDLDQLFENRACQRLPPFLCTERDDSQQGGGKAHSLIVTP